jgi:hypothetical protein
VKVHSLTFSYTLGSMKCHSRASFLTYAFTSPYLGREPKAKVATIVVSFFVNLCWVQQVNALIDHLSKGIFIMINFFFCGQFLGDFIVEMCGP